MKRDIRKDIRWNQYEIDKIESVRDEQDFSEFVRDATMDKVIKFEHDRDNKENK